jgi:hypothetical protein
LHHLHHLHRSDPISTMPRKSPTTFCLLHCICQASNHGVLAGIAGG